MQDDITTQSDQGTTDLFVARMSDSLRSMLDEHAAPTNARVTELERHVADLERRLLLLEARSA